MTFSISNLPSYPQLFQNLCLIGPLIYQQKGSLTYRGSCINKKYKQKMAESILSRCIEIPIKQKALPSVFSYNVISRLQTSAKETNQNVVSMKATATVSSQGSRQKKVWSKPRKRRAIPRVEEIKYDPIQVVRLEGVVTIMFIISRYTFK